MIAGVQRMVQRQDILECSLTAVEVKVIDRNLGTGSAFITGHEQVGISVIVEVPPVTADSMLRRPGPALFGDILKTAIAEIAEKPVRPVIYEIDVKQPIIVEIPDRPACAATSTNPSGVLRQRASFAPDWLARKRSSLPSRS